MCLKDEEIRKAVGRIDSFCFHRRRTELPKVGHCPICNMPWKMHTVYEEHVFVTEVDKIRTYGVYE